VLFRALSKDPEQRFQSMAAFRAALLSPDGYAASQPAMDLPGRFTGRLQAALPMARSGKRLRQAGTVVEAGVEPSRAEGPKRLSSTLHGSVGEIDAGHRPVRSPVKLAQVVVLLSMAALAGVALASVIGRPPTGPRLAAAPVQIPGSDPTMAYLAAQARQLAVAPAPAPPPSLAQSPSALPFVNSPAKTTSASRAKPPAKVVRASLPYDDDGVMEPSIR
jgi:hypothetical protein